MTKLTIIKHHPNVDCTNCEDLIKHFTENKVYACFNRLDIPSPMSVLKDMKRSADVIVYCESDKFSEGQLSLAVRTLMHYPYLEKDVILLSENEPHGQLLSMADEYVDLCGLNSFKKEKVYGCV